MTGRLAMLPMFIVTMGTLTLTAVAMTAPLVLAPVVTRELSLSPGLLGAYVSGLSLFSLVSSIGLGGLTRRFGAVRTSQVAALSTAFGLGCAATATATGLIASVVFLGVGLSIITPAASHLIIRFTDPARLGLVFSIRQTGVPIGAAIAGAGIPPLLLLTGWQQVTLLIMLVFVVSVVLLQPLRAGLDDDRDAGASLRPASIVTMLKQIAADPVLRGIAVAGLGCSIVQNGLLSYLVTYLTLDLDYSLVAAGLVLTASQLAAIFGRMFWGGVSDRLGDPLGVLALISILSAAICLALGFVTGAWPVALVMFVAALFGGVAVSWNGVFLGGVARYAPQGQVAMVTSGVMVSVYLGALIGPALYAVILSVSGMYRAGYLLFAIVPLLAGISVQSIRRRVRRAAG